MRRCDQMAVEVIGPLVVRAQNGTPRHYTALNSEPRWASLISPAQARATMPTNVIERSQFALAIAHEEDALPHHIQHLKVAGCSQLFLATDAQPLAAEDSLALELIDLIRAIPARRQGLFQAANGREGFERHIVRLASRSSYSSGASSVMGTSRR